MIHGPSDFIGPLSELEVIKPLEDLFEKTFLDSFILKPFPANTYFQGHLYQIADRVGNHLCLVYNKDLVPQPPRTMDELIHMGQELIKEMDRNGDTENYALAWNYTEPFFAVPFIGGYGGWIMDSQGNPTLDTPAVIKAAQLIYDLANKYRIIPRESDYETANALFIDKRVAMIINGPWSWGTYLNRGISIGVARIPKIDETGLWPTPMVSPMGYLVNVNEKGERLKIITQLIHYLTRSDVELEFSLKFGTIPSRKDALADPEIHKNELLNQSLDQMMVGRPMPVVTELRWIWDAMRPAYQGIFTNQVTPEQAAVQMQKLAEKLISENRK
jgi:arabinogalactan oligomer/maltooligosaccharide transport system permease protein